MELCSSLSNISIAPIFFTASSNIHCCKYNSKRSWITCASSSNGTKEGQMSIAITGATGFVGRRLVHRLLADDHKIHVLTRSRRQAQLVFPVEKFPNIILAEEGEWNSSIQGSDAVVNLAGMPISTRWTPEIKKEIKESRIRVTSKVVDLINNTNVGLRPSVFVSATAVGYYGTSETRVFDETSPSGNDYLSQVCREWEGKAAEVDKDVRLVLIRIGVVLGKDGGALAKMIPLFMLFAGGPLGNGREWFSWIHLDDLVNLIYEAIKNPSYKEVVSCYKNLNGELHGTKAVNVMTVMIMDGGQWSSSSRHNYNLREAFSRCTVQVGSQRKFSFPIKDHLQLGKQLDLFDFDAAAEVSGSKFYYLKNQAVLLEMALVNWAVSEVSKRGFTPISPPEIVRSSVVEKCGFQPRGQNTQIVFRPESSKYKTMRKECSEFNHLVSNCMKFVKELKSSACTQSSIDKANSWQITASSFIDKLSKDYAEYKDLIQPLQVAIYEMKLGLSLAVSGAKEKIYLKKVDEENSERIMVPIYNLMRFPRELTHEFTPDYVNSLPVSCISHTSRISQVIDANFVEK